MSWWEGSRNAKQSFSTSSINIIYNSINNVLVGRVKKGKTIIFHLQVAVVESSLNAHQHHCHCHLRIIQSQVDKWSFNGHYVNLKVGQNSIDGKIPLAGACCLLAWMPLDKAGQWGGDQKEEQPGEWKYHLLKVRQKKKQVRSQGAWNLNHSGQGVCGEEEGGKMVGPVPLGNIEDVSEEEKQIKQMIMLWNDQNENTYASSFFLVLSPTSSSTFVSSTIWKRLLSSWNWPWWIILCIFVHDVIDNAKCHGLS